MARKTKITIAVPSSVRRDSTSSSRSSPGHQESNHREGASEDDLFAKSQSRESDRQTDGDEYCATAEDPPVGPDGDRWRVEPAVQAGLVKTTGAQPPCVEPFEPCRQQHAGNRDRRDDQCHAKDLGINRRLGLLRQSFGALKHEHIDQRDQNAAGNDGNTAEGLQRGVHQPSRFR
jgi:hypothetical protein